MSVTTTAGSPLVPHDMNGAIQLAQMMAKGKLVPTHLRDSPGDCLMIIEQSMRWNMSPFAVAQCTSVISGKLMFEGKLVSAALHTSGIMSTRLRETFSGSDAHRMVTMKGTLKGETEPREITVTLAEAKTTNQMWLRQPDQQLIYFATRAWARRHAPEVMLGVYSPEESDVPDRDTFAGPTIEATPETAPAPPKPPTAREAGVMPPQTLSPREWLDGLRADLEAAKGDPEKIDAILAGEDVQEAQDKARGAVRAEMDAIIQQAILWANAAETTAPVDGEATS